MRSAGGPNVMPACNCTPVTCIRTPLDCPADSSPSTFWPAGSIAEPAHRSFPHRRFPMATYRQEFEWALPRIELHARIVFRDVACRQRQDDCIAEVIALSWSWWLRLRRRGKNPEEFVGAIATFAARAVRSGRRLCGQERAQDAMSPSAQRRHGFTVSPLPDGASLV